jgi:AAA15 family ATPase/GTPase
MSYPKNIKIKGYKCFSDNITFESIECTNILIGRNNIGKSSALDVFDFLTSESFPDKMVIEFDYILEESYIKKYFSEDRSGGEIRGNHWGQAGCHLVGEIVTVRISNKWIPEYVECKSSDKQVYFSYDNGQKMIANIPNPFKGISIRKILAERDIVKEKASLGNLTLNGNGEGATNIIQNIINKADLDASIVQNNILNAFNEIMFPDMEITNIVTRIDSNNEWEIYLDDKQNGRVALSKCGSGLKTVILTLINLFAFPIIENRHEKRFFIFEELENNLHPALQRRLYTYVYNIAKKYSYVLFITTHSNVTIDLFSYLKNVNLYLLIKKESKLELETIHTIFQKRNILDELDIRASDLLQTNSLIWVEGPSDRLYINKFISFYANDKIKEGLHFQYVYYGGRLLSHYTAEENDIKNLLSIIKINMNSFIILDSDKKNRQASINQTKKRILDEFDRIHLPYWITKGREIENYIPLEALKKYLDLSEIQPLDQYSDIQDYLNEHQNGAGAFFERNKVAFAEKIVTIFTKDDIDSLYDIKEKIELLISFILKSNKLNIN